MKRLLLIPILAFAISHPFDIQKAHAELRLVQRLPDFSSTHWKSDDSTVTEIWLIEQSDGAIILRGRDSISSYEGILLNGDAKSTFLCHGTGFRFSDGFSFTYTSTITSVIDGTGQSLHEEWRIVLANGERVNGKSILKFVERHSNDTVPQ